MAESYRGLTIQIGGDTKKLDDALKSSGRAISGTQSELKKLNEALKLDPSSLKASQLQVGAFAAQASNAATRMATLNQAMKQVANFTPAGSTQTIKEMVDGMSNVQAYTARTKAYYSELTSAIATSYTELTRLHGEAAKVAGDTTVKSLQDSIGNLDFKTIREGVKELNSAFGNETDEISTVLSQLKVLEKEYNSLTKEAQKYKNILNAPENTEYVTMDVNGVQAELPVLNKEATEAAASLQHTSHEIDAVRTKLNELISTLTKYKGMGDVFKFNNKNVDLSSLYKALSQIVAAGKLTVDEADEMMESFVAMKNAFTDAFDETKAANMASQFVDLRAEAEKTEAKVKSLVQELMNAAKADATRGIAGLEEKLKAVSSVADDARTRMKETAEVIKQATQQSFDKTGEGPSEAQMMDSMRAYADYVAATTEKVNLLQQQIAKLSENESVKNLAYSMRELVTESQAAEAAMNEMNTAVATYEAALAKINEERDIIKANDSKDYADDERYQELTKQAEAFEQVLEITRTAASGTKKEFVEMSQALTLRDKEHELVQTKSELEQISKINIKPQVDVSALEGVKKLLDALSKGEVGDSGMSKFRQETEGIVASLDEAKKRYEALKAASKDDPTNSETTRQKTEALNQVIELTKQHIAAMKKEIANIPSDRINKAAIESGKVGQAYKDAKQQVETFTKGIESLEGRIKIVKDNLKNIEVFKGKDSQEAKALNDELEELKQRLAAMQAAQQAAFDNLAVQENTRHVQENTTAIQQDEAALRQYKKAAEGLDLKPPKVDEAAFMQVVSNITQSVRRMGQEVIQSSDEIDKAFRDMTKTVNAGEEQLNQLKDTAIEYSQTHITSADTMLEMQALGGQLGIAAENLEKFGKIASNLDIATDMDAETIALKLGQISNILGLDIDGMEGFSDALVRLGNNMPAQESAIMAVAQRFGAVAATASFSSDEVLAWSASIAATGQRSEAAATAISNTVSGIEQAVANGGNDLKQFAAIASMSAEEFKQSWKDSPTETLRAFIQGLETLKDSDESAVAALENMGITGVRQQQTLLALTQTIDNLDDALLMSSNAWNGISDQWGNAGDAANEAEKKSQGFSGALAIMQNNAQNLGAALGEGLIPFMNIASDLMGILTDALNSMSPTLKTITVFVGGLGIAFGTVIPVISAFSKGIGAIVTAAGSASSIGAAVTQVLGLGTAMEGAAGSATLLGGAMGGPVTLGVMAAVGALAYGISMIADYCAEQEELRQATEGLVTAMNSSDEAYSTYISGADESTRSVAELRDAINDATAAQANYAKTLSEAWGEIGNKEATVDTYVGTIEQLTSKTHLSEEEQKKLALAVEAYNNLTGDSVHIIDAQKGVLDKNAAAIVGTADAWKDTLENEQAIKQYGDSVSEMAKQQELLDDTNAKIAERGSIFEEMIEGAATARDEYYELAGSATSVSGTFMSMVSGASNAARSYYDLDVSAAKAKETIKSQADLQEETAKKMGDIGNDLLPVEEAFRAVGRSLTEYGSLTDEECDAITKAFNDSSDTSVSAVDRVINAMNVLRASAGNASEIANQLAEASKEAIKERYNAAKASFKEEYNNLKRQLDADYKAQQRAFNQEYKAQQKAYDAEYKAQQKEYDKQYKALQKKLDNEYKARKKAYDDQLKALKKSQSDEVDAFKKATDAKLKEMEKEYKQRVKNLELQYGGQTDDIDEQIKQLKGETEAEKKAIEERKENEKIGELQKEVDRAKSRRKRAEAEKALNDYLTEIEQKRNEESREAQITQLEERKDQLKDELADRKEQLKAEYDAEVEAYKERRAAELEAMQEANTLEYEAKQEYYNTQLEQLKEAQTAQLETTKEAQQAALESLKESQQASLEALKDSQQEQLEAMKENQQIALENMKNDHNIQLEQTKADQDARLAEIKKGLDAELDEIEKSGDEKVAQTNKTGSEMSDAQYRHLTAMEKKLSVWGNNTEKTTSETGGKVVTSVSKSLDEVGRRLLDGGDKAVKNLDSSLKKGEEPLKRTTTGLQTNMIVPFQTLGADALRWGADMIQNLSNGIANEYNRGYLLSNVSNIASGISSYLHFSVPDKGPLATEDEWGGDMVQNLIDGMRSKERDLLKQTKRMADIIEDGFNPSLTVDAAYEAIDTINQRRSSALSTMVESKNTPNININLNMNLSNVSIRDDSDIEKLAKVMSQEMATQAARQLAGRLG